MKRLNYLNILKMKITKDEKGENAPHLEITEVVLVHCSIALHTFVPNKSFYELLGTNGLLIKILKR